MNLQEACKAAGIKAILADLDDTFIRTNFVFMQQMVFFYEDLAISLPHIEKDHLDDTLTRIHRVAFQTHGVGRESWREVARLLTAEYGAVSEAHFLEAILHIDKVYTIAPPLRDGAQEFLKLVQDSEVPFGIITHADEDWTELKINEHNLRHYAQFVKVVPGPKHKTSTEWAEGINMFPMKPSEVLAIGDSIKTDIIPAYEAGVQKIIWLDNPESWQLYRTGELPPTVKVVHHLSEIVPLLLSNPW